MKKIKEDNLKELQHKTEVLLSKFEDKKTKQKQLIIRVLKLNMFGIKILINQLKKKFQIGLVLIKLKKKKKKTNQKIRNPQRKEKSLKN